MSEEEKEVIIFAEHFIKDDEGVFAMGKKETQTLLNLIEKQQKKIENSVSKDKIKELEKKYAKRCAILHRNASAEQWYSMGKNIGRTEAYQELLEGVDSI